MKTIHKKILLAVVLGGMIALAGCNGLGNENENSGGAEDIGDSTGTDIDIDGVGESYWYEIGITEQNQKGLIESQPPFEMENSLERQNLIDRYKYLNDANNQHHVYMLSNDGKVINYEIAQGKVSSVNSKLTNDKQIVRAEGCDWKHGEGAGSEGACFKTVESPQMDGSYGENGDAIFFFNDQGEYVEWNGIYVVSEEPKEITTEVTLVDIEDDDINGTAGD